MTKNQHQHQHHQYAYIATPVLKDATQLVNHLVVAVAHNQPEMAAGAEPRALVHLYGCMHM